ncbi:MAG: dUTP diphosphatase, partial [Candidatus Melainabacteria bacterium HGW-Melainabacteria-1]
CGPQTGYEGDLGIDLCTPESLVLPARGSALVDTGIRIRIPEVPDSLREHFQLGCFIWAKSGLSVKSNIEKGAGVVDPGYTGPLRIKLYNHGDADVHFAPGDKIAQMVFMLCAKISAVVEVDLEHVSTERGERGFGSSGR